MQHYWTSEVIPDLTNRNAVVTGAGRKIGQLIIQRLSEHGAHVFAISRDEIPADQYGEGVEPVRMIPTSMESIHRGAEEIRDQVSQIDILVHAASISAAPRFRTREGHDLMFATNYLGFVLLANELAPAMEKSDSPRIVLADPGAVIRRDTDIDLDRLDADGDFSWDDLFIQSRLAAMMFSLELSVRAERTRPTLVSAIGETPERHPAVDAYHPVRRLRDHVISLVSGLPHDAPAHPVLFASTSEEAHGGEYYAPAARGRVRSEPIPSRIPDGARSDAKRQELWQRTEDLLGVHLAIA